jgi:hypothetical protein
LSVAVSRNVVFFDSVYPFADSQLAQSRSLSGSFGSGAPPGVSPPPSSSLVPAHFVTAGNGQLAALGDPPSGARPARITARPALFDSSSYEAQARHDRSRQLSVVADANVAVAPPEGSSAIVTPETLRQALDGPQSEQWAAAVARELTSLRQNHTYVSLEGGAPPRGRYAIPSRFVFKVKRGSDGTVDIFKARMVAKGFRTRKGIDYQESFAPTLRTSTFRMLCALACQEELALHQMDVSTAFLVPSLDSPVFLQLPEFAALRERFPALTPEHANVRLEKALYGLVNSPRLWNRHLTASLSDIGFVQSTSDPCLYVKLVNGAVKAAIAVFVDDLAIAAPQSDIELLKAQLSRRYRMTDGGPLSWFLAVRVTRHLSRGTLSLDQEPSINQLLADYGMTECNSISTPAEVGLLHVDRSAPLDQEEQRFMADKPYRALVGSLLYLLFTRPDIAFAVGQLSRFLANPNRKCWVAALRVLRYLKGTSSLKLTYEREEEKELSIVGFSDADFAGCKTTRRSTTGFVFIVCGAAITFKSKLQKSVALSTCEAELVAFAAATQEAIWIRRTFNNLGRPPRDATVIYEDNSAALSLMSDHRFSVRTKHVDIKAFFIHEHIEEEEVAPTAVRSTDNVSDIFTKPLGRVLLEKHRASLGLR